MLLESFIVYVKTIAVVLWKSLLFYFWSIATVGCKNSSNNDNNNGSNNDNDNNDDVINDGKMIMETRRQCCYWGMYVLSYVSIFFCEDTSLLEYFVYIEGESTHAVVLWKSCLFYVYSVTTAWCNNDGNSDSNNDGINNDNNSNGGVVNDGMKSIKIFKTMLPWKDVWCFKYEWYFY